MMPHFRHTRNARNVPAAIARSLADAKPGSFWLDSRDAPEPLPPLAGTTTADLAVIGGGFTGLWTALLARERDPSRDVVLLEARTVGHAASGRNGGFCSASLTHGTGNGLERFGDEMPLLERLGEENLQEIAGTISEHGIDCDFSPVGELSVATAPWQLDGAEQDFAAARELGRQLGRARVGLRPDDRAAHRRAVRQPGLDAPARGLRHGQPVPLLPADARQPGAVGRV
jgi:glycine/D-amino acid oxidase-like deaminating enzyme